MTLANVRFLFPLNKYLENKLELNQFFIHTFTLKISRFGLLPAIFANL